MSENKDLLSRHSIRLSCYNYSTAGAYFVTVCVMDRACLLGAVHDGNLKLNDAGRAIAQCWTDLPTQFENLHLDEFVIMPNHLHGILFLEKENRPTGQNLENRIPKQAGDHKDRPYGTAARSLGRIIQAFKSLSTNRYIRGVQQEDWLAFNQSFWQPNFYEHVIRSDEDLYHTRKYIQENPLKWSLDKENPDHL